jgi:large subunit ribosomal protein L14e
MIEIGRICVKTAGRDAGLKCVVVEILDNNMVMIDGQTRRRKCNMFHLEPLDQVIKIKPKASHDEIAEEFSKLQIEVKDRKPKQADKRPRKIRKKKVKPAGEELSKKVEKAGKKEAKKEEKPKKAAAKKEEKPKAEKKE